MSLQEFLTNFGAEAPIVEPISHPFAQEQVVRWGAEANSSTTRSFLIEGEDNPSLFNPQPEKPANSGWHFGYINIHS